MGGSKDTKASIDISEKKRSGRLKAIDHPLPKYLAQLPRKLQLSLQSRLKKFAKDSEGVSSAISSWKKEKQSSTALEVNLEKQLQAWRENPEWTNQPPEIKVSVPKGSLCKLSAKVNAGLPPDAVYNIVIDPDNRRVFKNIKEVISRRVIVDEGPRQVVEVEQAALWNFLWWSGTISVHVVVDQNREDHTMKFKQVKTDYMEKFEGCWRAEPIFVDEKSCFPFKPKTFEEYRSCTKGKGRIGSRLSLEQLIQPAIVPPPPLSWYLRGITAKTTEMLVNDLLAETAQIRGGFEDVKSNEGLETVPPRTCDDECTVDDVFDIKERWAMRRRGSRKFQRRKMILKQSSHC